MKRFRLLTACFVGTFFYCLLAFIGGKDGLWAMKQLENEKMKLSINTTLIENTNNELKIEKASLQNDSVVITSFARKLGYINEGEKLIKISGLPSRESRLFNQGTVIRHEEPKYISEALCKIIGFTIGFLFYCVLILMQICSDKNGNIRKFKLNDRQVVAYAV